MAEGISLTQAVAVAIIVKYECIPIKESGA
jgi:hypothetical protein